MGARKSFKFVYIPWDLNEPVEERELTYTPEKEVECLLNNLKEHFARVAPKSDEHKAIQMEQLRSKVEGVDMTDEHMKKMLNVAADFTMAESIALLPHHPSNNSVGVSMYVDDSGAIKQLPINRRASEIASCCDNPLQVHGDAFIARTRDNEDEFERMDFLQSELSSTAAWVQEARKSAQRRREQGDVAQVMEKWKQEQEHKRVKIEELTPAEVSKDAGNEAFKQGKFDEAVQRYSEAILLDDSLTVAYNNRAMAYLRLQQYRECQEDCERVLQREEHNIKALLRRATAREALSNVEGAMSDLQAVLQMQPANKEAATKLQQMHAITSQQPTTIVEH